MVKTIMKDVLFLGQESEPATPMDGQVVEDLLDTLKAHEDGYVGMAANMRELRGKWTSCLHEWTFDEHRGQQGDSRADWCEEKIIRYGSYYVYVNNFAVESSMQGRGIGTQLMEHL